MFHGSKYLIYFLLLFFLVACFDEVAKETERGNKTNSRSYFRKQVVKFYQSKCKCGDAEIIVKTKYITVPDSVNFWGVVVLKQELIFSRGKGGSTTLLPPFRITKRSFASQDSFPALETMLVAAKCLQKRGNYVYQLHGTNSFDPPHEFFALCSLDGEWLWYYYGSMHEVYEKRGNDQLYESVFGKEMHSLKNMITVFPPLGHNNDKR